MVRRVGGNLRCLRESEPKLAATSDSQLQNVAKPSKNNTNLFNTLRPRQNGQHLAEGIFTCIVSNENDIVFTFKFQRRLFQKVQLTICLRH